MIPARVVQDAAGRLLVLPVAREHVRPVHEDLTVFSDAHLDIGEWHADGAEPIPIEPVERDRGRALRRPVALQDVDAELAPGLPESGIERRAAGHDVAEAPAELPVHAGEQDPPQAHRQVPRDPAELREELGLALRLGLALDPEEDRPHGRGRDQDHRHAPLLERAADDRGLPARGVHDGRAGEQKGPEARELLEHVRERDEREEPLLRPDGEDLPRGLGVRQHVAVGEHRALRIAGRARREHHLGEVVPVQHRRRQRRPLCGELGQLLHVVQRDAERQRPLPGLRRHDRGGRPRPLHDLLREVGQRVHVERDEDRADAERRQEPDPVLGPVHAPDHDAVAARDPRIGEVSRDPRHELREIAVCPDARSEARPDDERGLRPEARRGGVEDLVQRVHAHTSARSRSASRAPPRSGG